MNIKKLRLKLLVLIMLFIFIFLISLTYWFYLNKPIINEQLYYSEEGKINYQVCLNENDYILEKCFTEDRSFIASLINNININYIYNYNASNTSNYNYNYEIKAIVKGVEKQESSRIVYLKEEILKEEKITINNTSNIYINEKIDIDYYKYNKLIMDFKKNYVISLNSNLYITIKLKINDTTKDINIEKELELIIPLGEQTVNIIDENSNYNNNDHIYHEEKKDVTIIQYLLLSFSCFIDIIFLYLILSLLLKILKVRKMNVIKIKKILKEYDGVIAIVKEMPNISKNIINVYNFSEMIDIRNSLNKPILFYENKDKANFIILNEDESYIFKINKEKSKTYE